MYFKLQLFDYSTMCACAPFYPVYVKQSALFQIQDRALKSSITLNAHHYESVSVCITHMQNILWHMPAALKKSFLHEHTARFQCSCRDYTVKKWCPNISHPVSPLEEHVCVCVCVCDPMCDTP